VIVPRFVVVVVGGAVVVDSVVVGSVVVLSVVVEVLSLVVVVVVELDVVGSVVVDVVELDVVELVVSPSSSPPETTASAMPSPSTAATRITISAFIPELIPDDGGSPGGWP
jgi:hypothetical protein